MNIPNFLFMLFGISILIFLFRKYFGNKSTTPTATPPVVVSGGGGGGSSSSGGGSGSPTNSISIISQTLADIYTGTNNVSVVLTAPTIVGTCADTNSRKVSSVSFGVVLKKNGNITLAAGDTFLATDAITVNINSTLFPNTTQQVATHPNYVLFTYKAVGVCGDSNEAEIKTTIKVAVAPPQLPSFTIQDAYLSNGNYVPYASLVDAMDKNFDESGFTNRNATLYTVAMENGQNAYLDATGTTKYPEGNYFFYEEFKYLAVNANGVLYAFPDIEKPTVTPLNYTDGFTS